MGLLSKYLAGQRYARVAPYIQGDILDLGCQNGQILDQFGPQITSYCGVELSQGHVERLKASHPEQLFLQRNLDQDRLALDQRFDRVLMIALLEHLFNQKFAMDQVAGVLKPGGQVIITTPTPFGNDVVHRLGAALGLFARAAVDDHIVLYNRHRFRLLAAEVGLRLKHHAYFQFYCNQIAILEKPHT